MKALIRPVLACGLALLLVGLLAALITLPAGAATGLAVPQQAVPQAEPPATAVRTSAEHSNAALNVTDVTVGLDGNTRVQERVVDMAVDEIESLTLTCMLDRSVPGASAVGTVTVDTLGSVAAINFTAWDIAVTTTNNVVLTHLNSVLDLGDHAPAITATANSLTIVPEPAGSLPDGGSSNFGFVKDGYSGQFYGLFHGNMMGSPSSAEVFRYGGSGAEQVINDSPPAELNLPCTCVDCPAAPALTLSKAVTPTAEVAYQGVVTYTLVLGNSGTASDTAVFLTDTLPAAVDFAYWIEQAGATAVDDTITWSGAVASSAAITVAFAVTNTASGGATITNTASFSGSAQAGSADASYSATSSQCYPSGSGAWTAVMAGCTAPSAKIIIPAGVTVTLDQDVTLSGDFEVEAGATFVANGKTVTLTGDQPQTLTGNPLTFYNLVINKTNTTDTVTISGKLKVSKKLTVRKGKLVSASDYQDIDIQDAGELALTSDITVGGHFTKTVGGTFTPNDHTTTFDGATLQNVTLGSYTDFYSLVVLTDTVLVEVDPSNSLFATNQLTNYGVIRKTQGITALDSYDFGLAGDYRGGYLALNVTTDNFDSVMVERRDQDHASRTGTAAGSGVGWGIYWTITPTGTGTVDLTLPHNLADHTQAKACRYTGSGITWDCARDSSDATTVTRNGVTTFSDWAVGSNVGPNAVSLSSLHASTHTGLPYALAALVGVMLALRAAARRWPRMAQAQGQVAQASHLPDSRTAPQLAAYVAPTVVHEAALEARAGSPLSLPLDDLIE